MKKIFFFAIVLFFQLFQTSLSLCSWDQQIKGICESFFHRAKDTIKDNSNNIAAAFLTTVPALTLLMIAKNSKKPHFNNLNEQHRTSLIPNSQALMNPNNNNHPEEMICLNGPTCKDPNHKHDWNLIKQQQPDISFVNNPKDAIIKKQKSFYLEEEEDYTYVTEEQISEIKKNPFINAIDFKLYKNEIDRSCIGKKLFSINKALSTLNITPKEYNKICVKDYHKNPKFNLSQHDTQKINDALKKIDIDDEEISNMCINYYEKKIQSDIKKEYTNALRVVLEYLSIGDLIDTENITLGDIINASHVILKQNDPFENINKAQLIEKIQNIVDDTI